MASAVAGLAVVVVAVEVPVEMAGLVIVARIAAGLEEMEFVV